MRSVLFKQREGNHEEKEMRYTILIEEDNGTETTRRLIENLTKRDAMSRGKKIFARKMASVLSKLKVEEGFEVSSHAVRELDLILWVGVKCVFEVFVEAQSWE